MIADHGSLANDDTRTVVDEEEFTNRCAGMNIDTRYAMGMFRHHPRQHRNAQGVEYMGQTVNRDSKEAGIGENDLIGTGSRRVAVIGCLHIGLDHTPDLRNCPEELQADALGFLLCRLRFFTPGLEDQHDLAVQIEHHIFNQHRQVMLGVVNAIAPIPEIAGENDPLELMNDIDDDLLVGMTGKIDLINIPSVPVVLQNGIHHIFDLFFNGSHTFPPLSAFLRLYHSPTAMSIDWPRPSSRFTGTFQPKNRIIRRKNPFSLLFFQKQRVIIPEEIYEEVIFMAVKIEKETIIGDVLDIAPQAAPLFFAIGMHCLGCPSSRGETVEEACMVHGIECDSFLAQLNHFLEAYEADQAEKNA